MRPPISYVLTGDGSAVLLLHQLPVESVPLILTGRREALSSRCPAHQPWGPSHRSRGYGAAPDLGGATSTH
jgi:hypothetical protein